jgi:diguanylate cyclase (GGDEF)-like protein/PAS domain S-box-containing protein
MKPPKPEPDNVSNSTPRDTDEPTNAKGPPGGDDRWLHWVVHNSSEVVTIVDLDGTLRYASPAFERVLGYDPEQAVGTMNVLDHVHLDDLPYVIEETEKAVSEGGVVINKAEYRFRHRDGSWRWMQSIGTYLLDVPAVRGVVVASRDVTERREAEEALRRSEAEIFEVLERITDAFFALDREWRFIYVNSQAEVLFSNNREDLIGERIWEDPTFYPEYRKAVAEGTTARFEAYYPPLGAWFSVRAYPSKSGLSVYLQDITERKSMEERLKRQALHDPLTGLPNRKVFIDRLGHALKRTRRRGNHMVAVMFLDLDGFKVVNDSLGHEMGDLFLTVVAQRLQRSLRPDDTLARFGGDEFVVLIENIEGPEDTVRVAERITEELGRPFTLGGMELYASASIGIGLGDARTTTPEDLLRDADTAMYRAKDEHATYKIFDPAMYERAFKRFELELDLRHAAETEQFIVHYLPIVDLKTDEVWGAEALMRWNHPERGLLNPSEFMPVVEESGLIVPLGERVLEEACRQAQRWQEVTNTTPRVVSVNFSAVQLRRSDLFRSIRDSLRITGLDARLLSLDVSESAYMRVLEDKAAVLNRIRKLGASISIDDFGVGGSSLAYLKRVPADTLKIDRSFVKGLGKGVADTEIVRMVIDLAHTLEMKVVAEGLEDQGQATLLKEMGCDLAQGFYFAKPMTADAVSDFLAG